MSIQQVIDTGELKTFQKQPKFGKVGESLSKFKPDDVQKIKDYVAQKLKGINKFSVATLFGGAQNNWKGTPLEVLYKTTRGNEVLAAILLGAIVFSYLAAVDGRKWATTKIDLNGRGLETNFYWLSEGK